MLLNINSEKLKQIRESKCWSQQQLADLSGLSLRTVQRIEAKGVASQESIKCLSAVFELDTQDLLDTTRTPDAKSASECTEPNERDLDRAFSNSATYDVNDTRFKQARRKMLIEFGVVFLTHIVAFISLFAAVNSGTIAEDTFGLLKDIVSIALVVSALALLWKEKRLKRKLNVSSW